LSTFGKAVKHCISFLLQNLQEQLAFSEIVSNASIRWDIFGDLEVLAAGLPEFRHTGKPAGL